MDIKKLRETEVELRGKRTQIEILMSDLQRQREEEEAEDDREMEADSGEVEDTRARPRVLPPPPRPPDAMEQMLQQMTHLTKLVTEQSVKIQQHENIMNQ
eukprot:1685475-Pyramimonas_sp.AAC.1